MRRRGVTVILGALITALLAVGVMAFPLPYVVLKPGPTVNTLGQEDDKEVIRKVTDEVMLAIAKVSGQEYVHEYQHNPDVPTHAKPATAAPSDKKGG